jgi:hypothetical protein
MPGNHVLGKLQLASDWPSGRPIAAAGCKPAYLSMSLSWLHSTVQDSSLKMGY